MAKRCASSRSRWTRYSGCEVTGSTTGSSRSGSTSSSRSLASPHSGRSPRPSSSSDLLGRRTWPRPPSMITRSGIAQRRASSSPSSPARAHRKRRRSTSWWLAKSFEPSTVLIWNRRYSPVRGRALLEHDHRADRLGALEVADVVALDPHRRVRRGPSAAASSSSAPRVLPSSASQRAASRASASAALRVARSISSRFSPRCGVRSRTRPPRFAGQERLEVRRVGEGARHQHLARDAGRPRVVLLEEALEHLLVGTSRGASRKNTSRPTIFPLRTTNSWTAAWSSWRASAARSSSVRAKAAIFWLSIVRSIARILSRSDGRPLVLLLLGRGLTSRGAGRPRPRRRCPRGTAPPARCRRGRRPCRSPRCTGPGSA